MDAIFSRINNDVHKPKQTFYHVFTYVNIFLSMLSFYLIIGDILQVDFHSHIILVILHFPLPGFSIHIKEPPFSCTATLKCTQLTEREQHSNRADCPSVTHHCSQQDVSRNSPTLASSKHICEEAFSRSH